MERRRFLLLLGLGVAGIALEQAIPLGRVWSFPKKIIIPFNDYAACLNPLTTDWERDFAKQFAVGTAIRVRLPQRFIVKDDILDFSKPPMWRDFTITAAFPPDSSRRRN
jgi:hypothetical protein